MAAWKKEKWQGKHAKVCVFPQCHGGKAGSRKKQCPDYLNSNEIIYWPSFVDSSIICKSTHTAALQKGSDGRKIWSQLVPISQTGLSPTNLNKQKHALALSTCNASSQLPLTLKPGSYQSYESKNKCRRFCFLILGLWTSRISAAISLQSQNPQMSCHGCVTVGLWPVRSLSKGSVGMCWMLWELKWNITAYNLSLDHF